MSKALTIGVREAALELGLGVDTIRRYCRRGLIQGAEKRGKTWYIPTPIKIIEEEKSWWRPVQGAAKRLANANRLEDRDLGIVRAVKAGESVREIACENDITTTRVYQIMHRAARVDRVLRNRGL